MRTYHVITPFSRDGVQKNYMQFFRSFRPLPNIYWHPVCHDTCVEFGYDEYICPLYFSDLPPITDRLPSGFYAKPGLDPMYWKLNRFIEHRVKENQIVDEDRYLILPDDSWYEPDFFKKVDKHDGDFIITSMNRGHHMPAREHAHPCSVLLGCPENTRLSRVGIEQIVLSGSLLRKIVFLENFSGADGVLIERLARLVKPQYADEAFAYFNYFEPGRWDK